MNTYLTYLYLLTPLHTGGSADEGNLMGIAREVHTEFPYLPASSLRGKIRSALEPSNPQSEEEKALAKEVSQFFGKKSKMDNNPQKEKFGLLRQLSCFSPLLP